MRTRVKEGKTVLWTNGTGVAVVSGQVVQVGLKQLGISSGAVAAAAGSTGSVALEGVYTFTKAAGAGTAFTQGAPVWIDLATQVVANAVALNTFFVGFADTAAADGAVAVNVALAPFKEEGGRGLVVADAALTVTAADLVGGETVVLFPNTAARAMGIPAAAAVPGAVLHLRKSTADAFAITITPVAGTIGGGATYAACDAANDYACFIADPVTADWLLIDSDIAP